MSMKQDWLQGFQYGMYINDKLNARLLMDVTYQELHPDLLAMYEAMAKYHYHDKKMRNLQ